MEQRIQNIFKEISRINAGKTRVSPETIQHFDKDLELYRRYCESLVRETEDKNSPLY